MAEIHPRTAPARRRPVERLAPGALTLLATSLLILVPAGTALAAKPRVASLTAAAPKVTGVTESSAKLRVSGTVKLPSNLANTAKNRNKVRVAVTIEDAAKKKQSFAAKIDAKRKYAVTKPTTLRGTLKVGVQVRVAGKPSGKLVTKRVTVKLAGSAGGASSGGGAGTPGGGSTPTGQQPVPADAQKLVGLFRLDPGKDYADGRIEGTYFRMGGKDGKLFLTNGSSGARDQTYTLLAPGTDGGLRTDGYQPPPAPAFDGWSQGVNVGNALAERVTKPQKFFNIGFGISTSPIDAQHGDPTPVPEIAYKDGKLFGQVTAWTAQWNGSSFAQGSPKPDGTLPTGTTPLSGSYDPSSGRYKLTWSSVIVGGPFDGYAGFWYLEGTFVPSG